MVDVATIKKLREASGAGMLDCKKALVENGGDYEEAMDWLRKKGIASASKKGGRSASEGLVGVTISGKQAAIVEVNSETDFVAKNDKFKNLVAQISEVAVSFSDVNITEAKLGDGKTIAESVIEAISTIGENIVVRRFAKLEVENGFIASYIHNAATDSLGKIGVIISIKSQQNNEASNLLARQIAMHIAASRPVSVSAEGVSQDLINKEKEIFSEQAKASGKPENIIEKMVEGRIRKFFEEITLLDQIFVLDGKAKVKDIISAFNKENNCDFEVKEFVRYELGEGVEKEEKNFADEVNSMVSGT